MWCYGGIETWHRKLASNPVSGPDRTLRHGVRWQVLMPSFVLAGNPKLGIETLNLASNFLPGTTPTWRSSCEFLTPVRRHVLTPSKSFGCRSAAARGSPQPTPSSIFYPQIYSYNPVLILDQSPITILHSSLML